MSKNTNLSFLADFITADIVNTRVGINNASPQTTFDVTGTGKFSGVLTLGSTVSNGTYAYTLPSATGTLALTSDIPSVSGYVPYTGATQAVNLGYNQLLASTLSINGESLTGGSYLGFKHSTSVNTGNNGYTSIYTFGTNTIGFKSISGATTKDFSFSMVSITPGVSGGRVYTLPDASGTIALTSNLGAYLPLAGGVMTGPITGTTSTFTNGGAGIGLGVTNTSTGDGIKITHSAGRAFNILSSGAGFGIIINNETASTSAPFTIQKQGANRITFTDAGAGTFVSTISANGATLTGALNGTSASFSSTLNSTDLTIKNSANSETLDLFLSPSTSNGFIDYPSGRSLTIRNKGSLGTLVLASTGAATFSSSVTANTGAYGAVGGFVVNYSGASISSRSWRMITEQAVFGDFSIQQSTTQTGSTFVDRLYINPSGNVGIGTATPANKLSVSNPANGVVASFTNTVDADLSINLTNGVTLLTPSTGILAFGTSSSEQMRITSGGNVLIRTTTDAGYTLNVAGNAQIVRSGTSTALVAGLSGVTGSIIRFSYNGGFVGSISTDGSNTAYNTSSDYRLKQDIKDFNGLDLLSRIKTYDFEWKSDKTRSYGVLAHELQEVINYAVTGSKDAEDMQGVDYSKIVPILIKAIQELNEKIK